MLSQTANNILILSLLKNLNFQHFMHEIRVTYVNRCYSWSCHLGTVCTQQLPSSLRLLATTPHRFVLVCSGCTALYASFNHIFPHHLCRSSSTLLKFSFFLSLKFCLNVDEKPEPPDTNKIHTMQNARCTSILYDKQQSIVFVLMTPPLFFFLMDN